jgi:hypothetical protein
MEFTRISKTHVVFEIHFWDQAPDSFDSSRRYPRFTQNTPRRRRETQVGPRPWGGGSGQNLASRRRGWPGKGRGGDHELTTRRFEAGNRAGMALASSFGGTGRRRLWWRALRRGGGSVGKWASRRAITGARGGGGRLGWVCGGSGTGVRRGGLYGGARAEHRSRGKARRTMEEGGLK